MTQFEHNMSTKIYLTVNKKVKPDALVYKRYSDFLYSGVVVVANKPEKSRKLQPTKNVVTDAEKPVSKVSSSISRLQRILGWSREQKMKKHEEISVSVDGSYESTTNVEKRVTSAQKVVPPAEGSKTPSWSEAATAKLERARLAFIRRQQKLKSDIVWMGRTIRQKVRGTSSLPDFVDEAGPSGLYQGRWGIKGEQGRGEGIYVTETPEPSIADTQSIAESIAESIELMPDFGDDEFAEVRAIEWAKKNRFRKRKYPKTTPLPYYPLAKIFFRIPDREWNSDRRLPSEFTEYNKNDGCNIQ